jgi:hypothetical protein
MHLLRRVWLDFASDKSEKGTSATRSPLALIGVNIVCRELRCVRASLIGEAVPSPYQ